jgi:serine protease Do
MRGGREAISGVTLSKLSVPGKRIVTDRPPSWRGIGVDYALAFDAAKLAEQSATGAIDPEGCVVVSEVDPDSPSWNAGVRSGMFISHVGDLRVSTPEEFRAAVQDAGGNVTVRLTQPIRRSDEKESAELQITPNP